MGGGGKAGRELERAPWGSGQAHRGAGLGGAPLRLRVSQERLAFVTTDPQPLPGGKPSGNGGCCPLPSPGPQRPEWTGAKGAFLLPWAGSPGHRLLPQTPWSRMPLFHFPEAQGGSTARPHPWPPLHPHPTVGQDSGPLGCGASPRGAGGKAAWHVLPPLVPSVGRRGLVLAGLWGPSRPPSYRHRAHTGDSGARGAARRAWGQRGGPRLAQGLGSRPLGPALPRALLSRVPQGGAQPMCTCRLAGWAEAVPCWDGHSWVGRHPGWAHLLALGRAGWGSGDGERQHLACRPQTRGQGADRSMHAARLLTPLTGECETPARRPDGALTQGHRKAGAGRPGGGAQRGAQRTGGQPWPAEGRVREPQEGPHLPEPREAADGPPQSRAS